MPNVVLTKNNGLALNLPADSITAIISSTLNPQTETGQDFGSVIYSRVRKFSVHTLAHSAREAADEIDKCRTTPSDWLVLSMKEDALFLEPAALIQSEEVLIDPDGDKTPENMLIVVTFYRPDGEEVYQTVSHTPENVAAIEAAALPSATQPTKENARAKR